MSADDVDQNTAKLNELCGAPGMPPLNLTAPEISWFEFMSANVFYFPMKVYAIWLAIKYRGITLPTASNPSIDFGGFVGESKDQIGELIPNEVQQYFAGQASYQRQAADNNQDAVLADLNEIKVRLTEAGLNYPVVAKPDIGCRGMGVQKIHNDQMMMDYIRDFPFDEKIVLQELIDFKGEAGVFYIRHPDWEEGQIFSLTLKYFPHVIGDGVSSLETLIKNDPRAGKISHIYLPRHEEKLNEVIPEGESFRLAFAGSHSLGTIFRDGQAHRSEAMRQHFDRIAKAIPELYFARFDVRFDHFSALETGEGMKIVEINGAGAEATHIWDSRNSMLSAYKTLMVQYDHMYAIGAKNRQRGFKPATLKALFSAIERHNRLMVSYPQTH